MASINTVYEKPIYSPPNASYGKMVVIVGLADQGEFNYPCYVGGLGEAEYGFGSGAIVDAFRVVNSAGGRVIYLMLIPDLTIESFKYALDLLVDFPVSIVLPVGIYFDSTEDYGAALVDFCIKKRVNCGECIGIINVSPFDLNTELTEETIDTKVTSLYNSTRAITGYDEGYFLNVVFGELLMLDGSSNGEYIPASLVYAGMLTQTDPCDSPVNKKLPTVSELRYELKQGVKRYQSLELSTTPLRLERIPRAPFKVTSLDLATIYTEDLDYKVDYDKGTIWTLSGSSISGTVEVSYMADDTMSLADVGIVTFMDFVRNGVSPASSVTMGKGEIKYVHQILTMQLIGDYVRSVADSIIGVSGVYTGDIQDVINNYLKELSSGSKIFKYDSTVSLQGSYIDIRVNVGLVNCVVDQPICIRMPLKR
jgi:hypothetical protein